MSAQAVTLYAMEEHLQALADTVDLVEPDREQEFVTAFADALKAVVEKRDAVGRFLAHLDSQVDLADSELKRLKARKTGLERVRDRVESYVQRTIESLGKNESDRYPKLEGNLFRFALSACPPSVAITAEDRVPVEYKSYTLRIPAELWETIAKMLDAKVLGEVQQHVELKAVSIDKRAIRADLDTRRRVPGANLAPPKYRLERK